MTEDYINFVCESSLSKGSYCLVVIDEYSRFPVIEQVKSTAARSVIPVLAKIFATHGIPEVLKTDNGPPFQSYEFRKFMEYCGTSHRWITPLWPRANAQAENFMRPLNKAIKAATVEGKSWRQELYKFLRNYRATPHVMTGKPPTELLFGFNIRILLPEVPPSSEDMELRARDAQQKAKQKHYADQRNCAKPRDMHVGDTVLIKQKKTSKIPRRPEIPLCSNQFMIAQFSHQTQIKWRLTPSWTSSWWTRI